MTFSKSFLKSKTIWGAFAVLLGQTLGLSADDVSSVTDYGVQAVDAISTLLTIGGAIVAIYGRIHATKEITMDIKKKN